MTDKQLEHQLSIVLRTGITVSGVLLVIGFILNVVNGNAPIPVDMKSGWSMFHTLFVENGVQGLLHPLVFLFAGIVVLMFTPILRVIFTIVGFSREKDWRYVTISSLVLFVIAFSIAFSIAH